MGGKINQVSLRRTAQLAWVLYFSLSIAFLGFIFAYVGSAPLHLLARVYSPARKPADAILRLGVSVLMKVQPWYNVELNLPFGPQGPCLMVSNHRSHIDAFILLSRVTGIRLLARESLFSFPGIGLFMRVSEQIPVGPTGLDSYLKAMQTVENRLTSGETVHIFPEMTRCSAGFKGTQTFSVMPFHVALQKGIPILPIAIQGTDQVWPKGEVGIHYRKPIKVKMLNKINPKNFISAQELRDEVQRQINGALS